LRLKKKSAPDRRLIDNPTNIEKGLIRAARRNHDIMGTRATSHPSMQAEFKRLKDASGHKDTKPSARKTSGGKKRL
jgi:hypothetical protein